MENANAFLGSNRQAFKDFIDNICSIPSSTATSITAIQPSYSTPLAILQRLPAGSREGFPSLPYLIDHARNFAELVELWLEHTKNLAETIQGAGGNNELLRFHNLCVALRKRTQDVLARAEQAERPSSALQGKWEALVDELARDSSLSLASSPPQGSGHIYASAPPGSSHGKAVIEGTQMERGGTAGGTSMSSSASQYAASESTLDESQSRPERGMGSMELNGSANGEGVWLEDEDEAEIIRGRLWTQGTVETTIETTALPKMKKSVFAPEVEGGMNMEKLFSFGRKKKEKK